MTFQLRTGITALALILAPLAVAAHHKSGHDGGNDRGHSAQEERGNRASGRASRDREVRQEESEEEGVEEEAAGGRPCAWGLAGRKTPCVPPGQARRGVTTDDWIGAPETVVDETTDLSTADAFALLGNTDRLPDIEEGQSYALVGDAVIVVESVETLDENGAVVTTYEYVSTYGRAAFPGQSGN